jgi:hypothetical protein
MLQTNFIPLHKVNKIFLNIPNNLVVFFVGGGKLADYQQIIVPLLITPPLFNQPMLTLSHIAKSSMGSTPVTRSSAHTT